MKSTVKLILWRHDSNQRGLYPIYLKLTIDRKTTYIATGKFVSERLWDTKSEQVKESHPEHSIINPEIQNKKHLASRKIMEYQVAQKTLTAKQLKLLLSSNQNINNLFDFVPVFISEVKHKRSESTLENYRKHLLKLELFHGSKNLTFEEITPAWLASFENKMRETVGANYTGSVLATLRTFFNAARKRGITTNYPFATFEMPAYRPPQKDYLNLSEIAALEKLADETTNQRIKQTAIYFLLGCFTGLRVSDWFTFNVKKNVVNNNIKLHAKKNGELVLLPIYELLERNLKRIEFTPLTLYEQDINETLKEISKILKIDKHITTHSGRHAFAVTICAEQGISSEVCATLMGITIKTCVENYYSVTRTKILSETVKVWNELK